MTVELKREVWLNDARGVSHAMMHLNSLRVEHGLDELKREDFVVEHAEAPMEGYNSIKVSY